MSVGRQYNLELDAHFAKLREHLFDVAANRSDFLELAARDFRHMRHANSILNANSELAKRMRAFQIRVDLAAASLQQIVVLMDTLELNGQRYHRQVLTATGDITTDIFDVYFVVGLITEGGQWLVESTRVRGPSFCFELC